MGNSLALNNSFKLIGHFLFSFKFDHRVANAPAVVADEEVVVPATGGELPVRSMVSLCLIGGAT